MAAFVAVTIFFILVFLLIECCYFRIGTKRLAENLFIYRYTYIHSTICRCLYYEVYKDL